MLDIFNFNSINFFSSSVIYFHLTTFCGSLQILFLQVIYFAIRRKKRKINADGKNI